MLKPKLKLEKAICAPAPKVLSTDIKQNVLYLNLAFPILDGIPKNWNGIKRKRSHIKEYGKISDLELEVVIVEDETVKNLHLSARIYTKEV